ncbi:MAG: alpha/beta hydrolase [Chromatiales bacterium]|nr:alpha/beta hydrolase [Chromatiales bacterium]
MRPKTIRQRRKLAFSVVLGVVVVTQLLACAGNPSRRYDARAQALSLLQTERRAGEFVLAVYDNRRPPGPALHVYLEGDGSPWIAGTRIADDPTARRPTALELLARDPEAGILVGRPCYHGHARDQGCEGRLWTGARYGSQVLDSLAAAIEAERTKRGIRQLWLIGFSGGGALAYLLAQRVSGVERLVTLGANLDVDAWTSLHGYLPLAASLNPANSQPLSARIRQFHYLGEADRNVPPRLFPDRIRQTPEVVVRRLEGFDHGCCWVDVWPDLLYR